MVTFIRLFHSLANKIIILLPISTQRQSKITDDDACKTLENQDSMATESSNILTINVHKIAVIFVRSCVHKFPLIYPAQKGKKMISSANIGNNMKKIR
jgi:hypothetical protein